MKTRNVELTVKDSNGFNEDATAKVKDLFPDGKKSGYIWRIPSEIYNSSSYEKPKRSLLKRILKSRKICVHYEEKN